MKKIIILTLLILSLVSINIYAQEKFSYEKYGNTFNLGLGIGGTYGYYDYAGHSMPVFSANYEFDVAKYFTLAPFISFSSSRASYYWGDRNNNYPYRYYYYHETVVPIGVKGTYYFDKLLKSNNKWDFYLAGSLGFAIISTRWDDGYYGDRNYFRNASSLFLDLHAGTEYHVNKKIGVFLDLSTGVSTIGLAIH